MRIRLLLLLAFFLVCPATAGTLPVFQDTDLPGNDISTLKHTTLEQCQQACEDNSTCQAYTFNSKAKWCFLKSAVGQSALYQGAISGAVERSTSQIVPPTKMAVANAVSSNFDDPFAYCAAAGTIDAPGKHYVGPSAPSALLVDFGQINPQFVHWRCMDGRVFVCQDEVGDGSCGKAPASVAVDKRGFRLGQYWYEIVFKDSPAAKKPGDAIASATSGTPVASEGQSSRGNSNLGVIINTSCGGGNKNTIEATLPDERMNVFADQIIVVNSTYATGAAETLLKAYRVAFIQICEPAVAAKNADDPNLNLDVHLNGNCVVAFLSPYVTQIFQNCIPQRIKAQQNTATNTTFAAFSNPVHLTVAQLTANPFAYQGKTVGVVATFVQMLSSDEALFAPKRIIMPQPGGPLVLHGVPSTLFTEPNEVAAVALTVTGTETVQGLTAASGNFIGAMPCGPEYCDWF